MGLRRCPYLTLHVKARCAALEADVGICVKGTVKSLGFGAHCRLGSSMDSLYVMSIS